MGYRPVANTLLQEWYHFYHLHLCCTYFYQTCCPRDRSIHRYRAPLSPTPLRWAGAKPRRKAIRSFANHSTTDNKPAHHSTTRLRQDERGFFFPYFTGGAVFF